MKRKSLKKQHTQQQRILLVSPPVYDIRLDWARWHQPLGLLQVGSLLLERGYGVRLFDCLQPLQGKRVQRKKLDSVSVENHELARWHFGWSWEQIEDKIEDLKEEKWKPDVIYVTCMMTFWWESTRDLVRLVRKRFPKARIILGGVYASLCPNHARQQLRGVRLDSTIGKKAKTEATDLSLYERMPHFSGVLLNRSRSANQIVKEIEAKIALGVREFAFFDDEIPGKNPKHFEGVLDLIIQKGLDIKLRALGNLSPKALTQNLVIKMREAGYRQIFLHDDRALDPDAKGDLSAYERGIELLLTHGGYKPRTEDITAMVLVGYPSENLDHTVERLTRLAHIVGSVNLVPFQPTPGTDIYQRYEKHLPPELEKQNGKLFPFAKFNGASFSDYQELTRLAALLNSKYRSTTFDFLGDDQIAQMVRYSIANETWKPKLRVTLPLATR